MRLVPEVEQPNGERPVYHQVDPVADLLLQPRAYREEKLNRWQLRFNIYSSSSVFLCQLGFCQEPYLRPSNKYKTWVLGEIESEKRWNSNVVKIAFICSGRIVGIELFASVALMFWYVLRLFMSRR